jgi:hypothetical protein
MYILGTNVQEEISASIFRVWFNLEDSKLSTYITSHHIPEDSNINTNERASNLLHSISDKRGRLPYCYRLDKIAAQYLSAHSVSVTLGTTLQHPIHTMLLQYFVRVSWSWSSPSQSWSLFRLVSSIVFSLVNCLWSPQEGNSCFRATQDPRPIFFCLATSLL